MKKISYFVIGVLLLLLTAAINNYAEPRRMVLEFCTGTWCGYCPCGDVAAEQILSTYPGTIVIAYHGASTDPWQYFNGYAIRTMMGFGAYPTGVFDRTNHPGNNGAPYPYITYNMWAGYSSSRMSSSPTTQINLAVTSSSYNSGTRELNVNVDATALQNLTGQYKISYILTENNVVYPQNFYSSCGTAGYHNDYVHKWIARTVVNNPSGDNMNSGTWNQNQVISKNVTVTIDNAWVAENCVMNIIVFKENPTGLFLSEVGQGVVKNVSDLVGIIQTGNEVPASFDLEQNYPNPFNPTTNIKFSLPKDGNVSLKIFNSTGQLISTYAEGFMKAGTYNADFDGSNLSSGIYFYTLTTSDFTSTKKMMLVK
ncbi:MAG: Omp28-related outer membrane protein [Ignavibacteria bacterium]|nr:Omp28-related outer membrane protein [Ignavibacteria bacterium]